MSAEPLTKEELEDLKLELEYLYDEGREDELHYSASDVAEHLATIEAQDVEIAELKARLARAQHGSPINTIDEQ